MLFQKIKEAKQKPDSDLILTYFWMLKSRFNMTWNEFENMPVPMIFELLEKIIKEQKAMKNGLPKKNQKFK